jgi:hypothetical protein
MGPFALLPVGIEAALLSRSGRRFGAARALGGFMRGGTCFISGDGRGLGAIIRVARALGGFLRGDMCFGSDAQIQAKFERGAIGPVVLGATDMRKRGKVVIISNNSAVGTRAGWRKEERGW